MLCILSKMKNMIAFMVANYIYSGSALQYHEAVRARC
jgi:hypothetical protein